jgi:Tfp pilus assembly protein PilP
MNMKYVFDSYCKSSMKSHGLYIIIMAASLILPGCSDQPASPPVQAVQQQTPASPAAQTDPPAVEAVADEPAQEGYVYLQRDRRDPFVPLIVPKKSAQKGDGAKAGTIEGYDLTEFSLSAIAKMGREYYALLTTADNKSFTVRQGARIGLNNGKVKEITRDKVVLVEYSRDFRGELNPRQILLEFHKGEVE